MRVVPTVGQIGARTTSVLDSGAFAEVPSSQKVQPSASTAAQWFGVLATVRQL